MSFVINVTRARTKPLICKNKAGGTSNSHGTFKPSREVKNLNDELEKWMKTNYKNLEKD